MPEQLIWSDEWEGSRFTYGLSFRPLGYAQVPDGWLIKSDRPHPIFKFGTVDFPRELTEPEAAQAELTLVAPLPSATPDTCVGCGTPASTVGARFCKACRDA